MSFNSPIAWFEIVAQDFDRACDFYSKAFDITFEKKAVDAMQMAIFPYQEGNVGGTLVHSPCYADHKPGAGTVIVYLNCDSVTEQLKRIAELGGKEIFPVTQVCDNIFIAGFEDSEGNYIGICSKGQ